MYLFDTNIFLEVFLAGEKAPTCQRALANLDAKHPGWLTSFSLHAIEAIISRSRKKEKLTKILQFCEEHPYLGVYSTTLSEEIEIAHLVDRMHLDFDDALQYYVAAKKKLTLVTLDRDFKKVRDIRVISPEVLTNEKS